MRKFLIAAAVAASALAVSAPAAAQWAPQPYGYDNGYNGYNGYGRYQGGGLRERLDRIQWQINRLDRRDVLSEREARYLRQEAQEIRYRLDRRSWNGLNGRERNNISWRIDRLEQRVFREARDGNGRPGYGDRDRWGYNDGRWGDRD